MKKLMLISMTLVVTMAIAQANKSQTDKFELRKQKMISNMNERIATLQNTKSCYEKAKSQEELKNCREEIKKTMKQRRAERQNRKEQRKQKD